MRTLQDQLIEKGITRPSHKDQIPDKHAIIIEERTQEEIDEKPDCLFCTRSLAKFAAVRGSNKIRCCQDSGCQLNARKLVAIYPY